MWPKELDIQESHELHLELGSYKRKGYSLLSFFTFLAPKYMLLQWSVRGAWKAPLEFSWLLNLVGPLPFLSQPISVVLGLRFLSYWSQLATLPPAYDFSTLNSEYTWDECGGIGSMLFYRRLGSLPVAKSFFIWNENFSIVVLCVSIDFVGTKITLLFES